MTQSSISHAVIPAAGLGSRFLPVTKNVPKELLPLLDLPCLWHVMLEAIESGVTHFVIVSSPHKPLVADFFQPNPHLEQWLKARNQTTQLELLRKIEHTISVKIVHQEEPLGLGHAVLCAEHEIPSETFMVLLPDDIIFSKIPVCVQMNDIYAKHQTPVVAVMEVSWDDVHRYGIVKADPLSEHLGKMSLIVEKPQRTNAPSNLAVVGRYILPRSIFTTLKSIQPGSGGEIQLTDALSSVISGTGMLSYSFDGERHDTGTPIGLLKASIAYAVNQTHTSREILDYIKMIASVA